MSINKTNYSTGFVVGGLLHHEFVSLKAILNNDEFATLIKEEETNNKYLGIKTQTGRKRVILEIRKVYDNAPNGFWDKFFTWNVAEQNLGLFFLSLKTYPLMFDIHFEVTVKKYKVGSNLQPFDITMRFDEISSQNDKVAAWSAKKFTQLNSKYRRIITDIGIFDGNQLFKPSVTNPLFWNYFEHCNESWFLEACFLR